jgi:hypothetical protein
MIEETSEKLKNRLLHKERERIKKNNVNLINIGSFYLPFQKSIPEQVVHAQELAEEVSQEPRLHRGSAYELKSATTRNKQTILSPKQQLGLEETLPTLF